MPLLDLTSKWRVSPSASSCDRARGGQVSAPAESSPQPLRRRASRDGRAAANIRATIHSNVSIHTSALRKWFGHKPERFAEFAKRYRAELSGNAAVDELRKLSGTVTLVYGAKDEEHNQAVVLKQMLEV